MSEAVQQLREEQRGIDSVVEDLRHRFAEEQKTITPKNPLPSPVVQQKVRHEITREFTVKRLPAMWRTYVIRKVFQFLVNLGPLQDYMADDVNEIMLNNIHDLYIERCGKKESIRGPIFESEDEVLGFLKSIADSLGMPIDRQHPFLNARLPDGSRVSAAIQPVSVWGPSFNIRRFGGIPMVMDLLIERGSINEELATYLERVVIERLNIIVYGGAGSGKTTLLNALTGPIPADQRILTIEDVAELQVQRRHVLSLEASSPDYTMRNLVQEALRRSPDRIIVGEVRGAEALDMLQAMNTGHDGSMSTLHANDARNALRRLENMALMAGIDMPVQALREQIAGIGDTPGAIHVLVGQQRLEGGRRVVVGVDEVVGMEGATPRLHQVFAYENGRHVQKYPSELLRRRQRW